jgi:hypothetical protein
MKRSLLLGMGLSGVLAALPVAFAFADAPPSPPTTYYGTASGAVVGQGVIAIVTDGSNSQSCGDGTVQSQNGGIVYVVDVIGDAQRAGCGAPDRQVQFYFTPTGGSLGKLSTASAPWQPPTGGPVSFNATLGSALTEQRFAPSLAKDGTYY